MRLEIHVIRWPALYMCTYFYLITVFLFLFQVATEKDFIDAINKVIKAYAKFSSTPRYMTYN